MNFNTGVVWDLNDSEVQSLFSPQSEAIGFYYTAGRATLYTSALYNTVGDVGTFASKNGPSTYLLGFDFSGGESILPTTFEVVVGVEPVEPVPEPTTFLLFGTGLASLLSFARRKKREL